MVVHEFVWDAGQTHRKMTSAARAVFVGGALAVLRLGEDVQPVEKVTAVTEMSSVAAVVASINDGDDFSSSGSGGVPATSTSSLVHRFQK